MASHRDTFGPALQGRHETAVANLAAKVRRVGLSDRIFRKFFINDVYSGASNAYTPLVPTDVQLPYIFVDHNALYRANRLLRPLPTSSAEFQAHAPRAGTPTASDLLQTGAEAFVQAFIAAWLEGADQSADFTAREAFVGLWAEGTFDLIYWLGKSAKMDRKIHRIKKALNGNGKEVKEQLSLGEADFVTFMCSLNIYSRSEILAQRSHSSGTGTESQPQRMGPQSPKPNPRTKRLASKACSPKSVSESLQDVNWRWSIGTNDLVKAVLVDIYGSVEQLEVVQNTGAAWTEYDIAMKILTDIWKELDYGSDDGQQERNEGPTEIGIRVDW
ncbi:hypothetical protein EK21DRAFT_112172 [Setomelanomma holmii]|uniref:Uncharacterized protein n=1 Tax=Setomelanomma holmii TaxID=210430 RepID=A0A9P4H8V5_9PLEO|nr:hypothetical protein EK21DRAFT_112172 [Setomelanomma holmii]